MVARPAGPASNALTRVTRAVVSSSSRAVVATAALMSGGPGLSRPAVSSDSVGQLCPAQSSSENETAALSSPSTNLRSPGRKRSQNFGPSFHPLQPAGVLQEIAVHPRCRPACLGQTSSRLPGTTAMSRHKVPAGFQTLSASKAASIAVKRRADRRGCGAPRIRYTNSRAHRALR